MVTNVTPLLAHTWMKDVACALVEAQTLIHGHWEEEYCQGEALIDATQNFQLPIFESIMKYDNYYENFTI